MRGDKSTFPAHRYAIQSRKMAEMLRDQVIPADRLLSHRLVTIAKQRDIFPRLIIAQQMYLYEYLNADVIAVSLLLAILIGSA